MSVIVSVRGLRDAHAQSYATPWEALIPWLSKCALSCEPDKNAIPLFSFAHFQGGIRKEHVQSISAVMLDYDGTTHEQLIQVIAQAQRYRGFAYTTYSHTLHGDPPCRFRVCLAVDKLIPPGAWELIWHRVGRLLGVISEKAPDRKTRDAGRFFFQPAQNPAGPPVWFSAWEGPPLSLDALLASDPNEPGLPPVIESELEQVELVSLLDLNQLTKKLQTKKSQEHQMLGRAMAAALRGEIFAADGSRNDLCYKLAGELAKGFPKGQAEAIAERFRAAFDLQGEPTVEAFAGQIKRQQLKQQQVAREKRSIQQMHTHAIASEEIDAEEPAAKGVVDGLPIMLQRDGFYWMRESDSPDYHVVHSKVDARVAIQRKYHTTLELADGVKPLSLDSLLLMYSCVVRNVEANYLATANTYDAEQSLLTLATAPRRSLEPRFHPEVDQWLKLLGGPHIQEIEAWIQAIFDLNRPSPALYLWGGPGAGKTLLASGLSRIWQHPYTDFSTCIGSFNTGLAKNPLVLADEGFPSDTKFTWLRSFLSTSHRSINEKYRPAYTLRGHVRLVVTANNPSAFEFGKQAFTSEDAIAIGERVIQIEVGGAAKNYLAKLSSEWGELNDRWVEQNGIAEHALWLAEQPLTTTPGRWAVVSKNQENGFESHLIEDRYAWFVAWLARYLAIPHVVEKRWFSPGNAEGWLVRTEGGKLFVSADAYRYVNEGRCEPAEFKKALRFFAPGKRTQLRIPGNAQRIISYRPIDVDRFFACAKDHVDLETLLDTLQVDTRTRLGV